ncbi:hypothetical protein ACFQ4K_01550 [Tistrella bauzanensis]
MADAGIALPDAAAAEADHAEADGATVVWLAAVPDGGAPGFLAASCWPMRRARTRPMPCVP